MSFLKRNIDITIILIIGFILRFSISLLHSYSNDELSAINRLRFDNFSDLIEFGVMKGDMHPAGVQVFMKFWSLIGGTGEASMRFPFVLCGLASVFMMFVLGLKWFKNRQAGLIAASLIAVLYFPIMNSEFARPYSPGLLIILLIAWFYHKVLFCEIKKYKNAVFLGVLFAAAMYTHYFAFMFAGFIGFTGLFFLRKDNIKLYALSGLIAILLFLPHYAVTDYHLNVGGLQWLGAPENTWLFQFVFHAFNESIWLIVLLILLVIASFVFKTKLPEFKMKYVFICALWFFGIYIVGHIYSLMGTPVLKYPVMLFALPFLILLISLLMARLKYKMVPILLILSGGLLSTVIEKDLYGNQHYGIFEEIAEDIVKWNDQYGEDNIYTVYNLSNPDYMNFYANQWGDTIDFDWNVIEFHDDMNIRQDLVGNEADYCIIGYSARLTLPQVFETVKEFYPSIVEYKKYNNAAVFLMSKDWDDERLHYTEIGHFEAHNPSDNWTYDEDAILHFQNGSHYTLNENRNYGPEFRFKKSDIVDVESKYIKVELELDVFLNGELTITVSGKRDGELIQYRGENFWMGHDVENQLSNTGYGNGYFAFTIPDHIQDDDELIISLWNRNGEEIKIYSYTIYAVDNIWN